MDALAPYLSDYWRQFIEGAYVGLHGLMYAYPPGAPTSATDHARTFAGPATPGTYEALKERLLDDTDADLIVLNCLTALEAYRNPYYAAALAGAVNDWVRDEFLARDERLRASIAVPISCVEDAVAEIERCAQDPRYVQVLLPVRSEIPWGHKNNHAIFAAAERHGLTVGLHAWGQPGLAPTPGGFTTTYFEDYVANQAVAQSQLISLVCEGVFELHPSLRVVLIECGFAWLAPLLWRFDKDWKALWREVPWVKQLPSQYVYRHVRATTAPAHLPRDPRAITQLLEMMDVGQLLAYASDYPHDHGDGLSLLLAELDDERRDAVLTTNAATLYARSSASR
jgi:predicted TIM-barrel fold metal-dependent hydrolase